MSGSAPDSSEEKLRAFRDRCKRIEKRGPIFQLAPTGPAEENTGRRRKARRERIEPPPPPRYPSNPLLFLVALAFGFAAVVAARYGRAEYLNTGLTGETAGVSMAMDFGAALLIALILKTVLGVKNPQFVAAQTIGAGLMVITMHNFVHLAPDIWELAFPEAWVAQVLAETEPHSILIQGISFVL
jgi:hypothetical protein